MERPLPKRDRRWSDPYLPLRPTELMPCLGVGPELMSQWDCLGGGALPVVPIAPRVMSLLSYLLFYLYFVLSPIITYYFVYLSIYIASHIFIFIYRNCYYYFFPSFPYLFNLF